MKKLCKSAMMAMCAITVTGAAFSDCVRPPTGEQLRNAVSFYNRVYAQCMREWDQDFADAADLGAEVTKDADKKTAAKGVDCARDDKDECQGDYRFQTHLVDGEQLPLVTDDIGGLSAHCTSIAEGWSKLLRDVKDCIGNSEDEYSSNFYKEHCTGNGKKAKDDDAEPQPGDYSPLDVNSFCNAIELHPDYDDELSALGGEVDRTDTIDAVLLAETDSNRFIEGTKAEADELGKETEFFDSEKNAYLKGSDIIARYKGNTLPAGF